MKAIWRTIVFSYLVYVNYLVNADSNIVTWGTSTSGGNSSQQASQLTEIIDIYSSESGFAALKKDRSLVTWGMDWGISAVESQLYDIVTVVGNADAFAALRSDGAVIS